MVATTAIAGAVVFATGRSGQGQVAAQTRAEAADRGSRLDDVVGDMTADVTVRHRRVSADGRPGRVVMQPVSIKLDRRRQAGRWRTTLTFQESAKPVVRTAGGLVALDNPFMVSRLEFDEDEDDARVYDRLGRRLARPTDADRRRFGITAAERGSAWDARIFSGGAPATRGRGRAWRAAGFIAEGRSVATRRAELQRKFGRATGRVRGLDRFVSTDAVETREVLVNPEAALPVEVNVVRGGALRERTELRYEPYAALGHVRQLLRTEQAVADETTSRGITEVELANVVVTTGGGR